MLFIFIFIQFSFSGPAFGPEMSQLFINRELFSGTWELSDFSQFNDSVIILSPSNSTTGYGYAWRLHRIPNTEWDGLFRFHVSNLSAFSQIGIYLTREFAVKGSCFGGPCKFYGIAILAEISDGQISFEIRKNNEQIDFINSSIIPEVTLPLNSNNFSIKIENSNDNLLKISSIIKDVNTMLYSGKSNISVRKNWISVTSYNNKTNNEISMTLANLSFIDPIYNLEDFDDDGKNKQNYISIISATEFDPESNLNNKDFKMISRVITQSKKNNDFGVDTDAVLEGIIEFSKVLEKSATVKQTNKIIEELLHPYTDSWKRRSYFIVNETRQIINELDTHLANSKKSISVFRDRITHNFNKLNESVIEIEKSLMESIRNSSQVVDTLEQQEITARGTNFVRFITYISIVEVIITIITIVKIVNSLN